MIALWYVPDEPAADGVRAAMAVDWPDRGAEVRVGARPSEEAAVEWDGATVRAWSPEGVRVAAAGDAHVAVLFARTWTLELEAAGPERFLPGPLPEPEAWVPPPPPDARVSTTTSGSSTSVARPVPTGRTHQGFGLGTRQSLDEPLSPRARGVAEIARRSAFADLSATVWMASDVGGYVSRTKGGEQVVELAVDRAAFTVVAGWRREGRLPLYLYAGPEVRAIEWRLYFEGLSRGGVEPGLAPALVVGAGAGRVMGLVELRAMPYVRATTVDPFVTAGLNLDALVRTRRAGS